LEQIAAHTTGELIIVAHSMGGLVTRVALNQLGPVLERLPAEQRPHLRVLTVDSPWHGFSGPPDRGLSRLMMAMVRPMLPDGLEDMRAESDMFQTLYDPDLPTDTELRLAFAAEGDGILYWGEGKLLELVEGLTSSGPSFKAKDPQVENYWRALQSSRDYPAFAGALRSSHSRTEVEAALAAHFPVYPGDHTGVLAEQSAGLPEAARRWILQGSWGK
jgi:pimeloyl-ACP methyl ester carboxylesterase